MTLADVEIGRVLLSGRGSYSVLGHATGAFILHLDTSEETGFRKNASADQVPMLFTLREAGRPLDVGELARAIVKPEDMDTEAKRRAVHGRLRSCLDRMLARGQVERVKDGRRVAFRLVGLDEDEGGCAPPPPQSAWRRGTPPRANVIVLS